MVDRDGASKVSCLHCGGSHRAGMRRCPTTGRALGGDPRLIGQLIDRRYRLVRLLGDGPFGSVYKAEHVTVGRKVSLRILPASLASRPEALQRFFKEARLISSVSHARLHPLLDAGLTSEGIAYVASQYISGRSLTATLAQDAPLPLQKAATLICHILEGLEAIHQSGFVHRALAPEAVLLQSTASGHEQALITNFGAAALSDESVPLPLINEIYAAPERRRGAAADRREDIYSAGVLLAAMLSPAGVPRAGGDLIAAGVPPSVEAIVAKAIHAVPSARFASVGDMRAALRPFAKASEEDPASATRTHISDLRALARRERALGVLPSRLRLGEQKLGVSVDGVLAVPILQSVLSQVPPASRDELLRRVPGIDRYAVGAPSVPLVLLSAALEEGDSLSTTNDRLFCTAVGEHTARTALLEALRSGSGSVTPEFFVDYIAPAWARLLTEGQARATHVGRGYGRLEIRDQAEPSLAVCACLVGLLSGSLDRLGAFSIEINKTACEAVGDPACVYSAVWA